MRDKSRNIISVVIILYMILSSVCFDDFKADALVYPSDGNESTQISIESCIKEDVCTVEMLGTTQEVLLCQQNVSGNSELHRKSELLYFLSMAAILLLFKFCIPVNVSTSENVGNLTEIILFIHNKDGKKKI
jgi:hypothetical protein